MMLALSVAAAGMVAAGAGHPPAARPSLPLTYPRRADGATHVSEQWTVPRFEVAPEPSPTETLVDALDAAYRTAPAVQARRYDLRSADEDYALALAETRPTTQLEITGGYSQTDPGRLANSRRSTLDRLTSRNIDSNSISAELSIDQPILTGGRASADRAVASHAISAGREQLRATEGDLLLQVITAYVDIRRDTRVLALRAASVKQFEATRAEVVARRDAGELTLTDIAQAETQLDVARAELNSAGQQLEQDRAAYASLVGRDPGTLAPEPPLPGFPATVDRAFDIAARLNPELAQAIATERSSRDRIAAAAAEGQPRLSLRASGTLSDQIAPFHGYNEDHGFAGQAVLTVPLSNGGRVGALIAQARDRNAADRLRIEETRREMVQAIVGAWNAVATTQRNLEVQTVQSAAARVLSDGTFEEYRAGLRSTFDVLFAQGSLRDAEIALVNSRHDLYVAQATLLRQIGLLEARNLLTGTPLYDPSINLRRAQARGALPWDPGVRALDGLVRRDPAQRGLEQPPLPVTEPALVPAAPMPVAGPATHSPELPVPGTVGVPQPPPAKP